MKMLSYGLYLKYILGPNVGGSAGHMSLTLRGAPSSRGAPGGTVNKQARGSPAVI